MRAEHIVTQQDASYPKSMLQLSNPPAKLYVAGRVEALTEGIGIIGARAATPYGLKWAKLLAMLTVAYGASVITGGARGCDTAALEGALEEGGAPVVFLAGGLNNIYPPGNRALFERVIDAGGALVSEQEDETPPKAWMFRARNRLTAALSRVLLVVEAGMLSGTCATCDVALNLGRDVWALPGPIDSLLSRGTNTLIGQGATPIISELDYAQAVYALFGDNAKLQ